MPNLRRSSSSSPVRSSSIRVGSGSSSWSPRRPARTSTARARWGHAAASAARNSRLNWRGVAARQLYYRRDSDGRLPVALAQATGARAPEMRHEAQVRDDARGGEGAEGRQVCEDARREARTDGAEPAGPLRNVEYRTVLQVHEAQVNVDAVAYALRVGLRDEARPVAEPAGHLADDLPHSGGPVGTRDTLCRCPGNLVLAFSVLREEHLRH